jgi:hypothetical protein
MAITDKARRVQRNQQTGESTTLVVVSPVVRRLRSVLTELADYVTTNGDPRQRKMTQLLSVVIDEAMEEMGETDSRVMAGWMHMMACVIEWSATGNMDVLPSELMEFACKVEGIPVPVVTVPEDDSIPVDAEIVG